MILSDTLKRWEVLKGRPAFLSTGTDEHGTKIQQAAIKEDVTPQELCDKNSEKFFELLDAGSVKYDRFIRTTEEEHKEVVRKAWKTLKNDVPNSMGLYKGQHAGWYSIADESFYAESVVEPSIEPQTGKRITVSKETGSEVTWVEEETWFFPLTKYKDALLEFYDNNPDWIQPQEKMNEVRNWVRDHLEDLSVTRPSQRLNWGVKDPDDSGNTIYVWVDALINYLTVSGYGNKWKIPSDDMGMWPADVHVVGKDIIRFHAVYWPALLLALGLPLPKKILCHNHWTMSGRKMSKSVGNVVNPFLAVERWGTDTLRYFLIKNGNYSKDMDYSNDTILALYTKDLRSNIGNLFHRAARPKSNNRWSSREVVESYFNGAFTEEHNQLDPDQSWKCSDLEEHITQKVATAVEAMDNHDPGAAINEIFHLLAEVGFFSSIYFSYVTVVLILIQTNRYISDAAPWDLSKKPLETHGTALHWVIFNSLEALRIAGILLQPVIPNKAKHLLDELRVKEDRRTLEFAKRGADDHYGLERGDPAATKKVTAWETIFPPPLEPESQEDKLWREATRHKRVR